jgi:hypothetical protein
MSIDRCGHYRHQGRQRLPETDPVLYKGLAGVSRRTRISSAAWGKPTVADLVGLSPSRGDGLKRARLAYPDDSADRIQQRCRIVAHAIFENDFHLLDIVDVRGGIAVNHHNVR